MKFTSYLPMVGGSLRILIPLLKLVESAVKTPKIKSNQINITQAINALIQKCTIFAILSVGSCFSKTAVSSGFSGNFVHLYFILQIMIHFFYFVLLFS
jgi:hypothetical protein